MAAGLLRLAARSLSHPLSRRAPGPARGLASSAAALAEDDYWSDWEDEEEEARRRARASAPIPGTDPAGDGPRGVQWVVMGRPGPQKHAHAARLAEVLDVPYISMGTLVRQELNPASQLYRKVGSFAVRPFPPSENYSVRRRLCRPIWCGIESLCIGSSADFAILLPGTSLDRVIHRLIRVIQVAFSSSTAG
jgi:hypothetical protein